MTHKRISKKERHANFKILSKTATNKHKFHMKTNLGLERLHFRSDRYLLTDKNPGHTLLRERKKGPRTLWS